MNKKSLTDFVKLNAKELIYTTIGAGCAGLLLNYGLKLELSNILMASCFATGFSNIFDYCLRKKTIKEILRKEIGVFGGFNLGLYLSYL